jgi:prepilin-type N-terminal cleavage/methylation domain-containing protein
MEYKRQSGFTIVELLIVIVVIGILAAITIVAYTGIQQRAQASSAQAALSQANKKLGEYMVLNSAYPADLTSFKSLLGSSVASTDYQYSVNNAVNPATYCVTATTGTTSYKSDSVATQPTAGACAGHGSGGAVAITNMITNPSAELNLTDIVGNASTVTRDTGWTASGTYSFLVTPNSGGTNDSFLAIGGGTGGMRLGLEAGKTYTVSATINLTAAQTGTLHTTARRILAFNRIGAGAYTSVQSAAATNAIGTTRLSLTFTLPAGATEAFIRFENGAFLGGGTVSYDAIMLNEGSVLNNFADGNSVGWAWTGAANVTTSTGPAL